MKDALYDEGHARLYGAWYTTPGHRGAYIRACVDAYVDGTCDAYEAVGDLLDLRDVRAWRQAVDLAVADQIMTIASDIPDHCYPRDCHTDERGRFRPGSVERACIRAWRLALRDNGRLRAFVAAHEGVL